MKEKHPKISIMIPAYNSEKTIRETIESARSQNYPLKEIVVIDDGSTDNTVTIAKEYSDVRVVSFENGGIGIALERCMEHAKACYVVYLCADDLFADENVVSDIVKIFDEKPLIGFINRWYYQFMNGYPGAVMAVRDPNLFISACNPSGMAFRKMKVKGDNTIFIEMPQIVKQYLEKGWQWTTMEYDTIAVRIHPGGNTGTKSSYYNDSPVRVWSNFLGKDFKYHLGLIQLKNCAPGLVMREIRLTLEINPDNKKDPFFWFCTAVAVLVPREILRPLSNFYRHRISRLKCKIIKRGEVNV